MQDTKQPLSQAAVKREPVSRGDDGSGFIAPDADTIRCAGSWNVVAADICFGLRMSPFVPNLAMQEPICRTNAVAGKVAVTVPCLAQVAHVPMETLMVSAEQSQDTLKLQLSNSTSLPHIVCPLHIPNLCEHTANSIPTRSPAFPVSLSAFTCRCNPASQTPSFSHAQLPEPDLGPRRHIRP